jgi:hypothetical protein
MSACEVGAAAGAAAVALAAGAAVSAVVAASCEQAARQRLNTATPASVVLLIKVLLKAVANLDADHAPVEAPR